MPSAQANRSASCPVAADPTYTITSTQAPKSSSCAWEGNGAKEGMTLWMWGEGPGQGGVEPNNSKQRTTQAKPLARTPQGGSSSPRYLDLRHHDPRLRILIQHAGDEVLQVLSYVGPVGENTSEV